MNHEFIGCWQLAGCKLLSAELKEIPDPFYDASGTIIYTKEGLMSAQIMQNYSKAQYINNINNLSDQNFKDLFHHYVAYYGSYEIDEEKQIVTHKVLGSQWPQMLGQPFTRSFEFLNNDTLVLSNTEFEAIGRQDPVKRYLTWNRIKI